MIFDLAKNFDKKIITLTLGSHPSNRIQFYADELLKLKDISLHIIIITGKNPKLYDNLMMRYKSATINQSVSISLLKYTNKFIEFLEISDIVLIKSGGSSMLECWNYAKPGRVFMIEPIYDVEKGNYSLSEDMKFSKTANSPFGFAIQVRFILSNEQKVRSIKQKLILEPSIKLNITFSHMLSVILKKS